MKSIKWALRKDTRKYLEDVDLYETYAKDPDAPKKVSFIKRMLAE